MPREQVPAATIGEVIRARRLELGITQEQLAEMVGDNMRQGDVSQLERGERRWHERLAIAEELLLEQRRGRAWFDEEEGRVRQALEAIAAERAAMPALPEAGELRRAASLLRGVARTLEQVTEAEHRRQVVAAVGRLVVEGVGRRCDKTDCGRVRVAWHPEYGALLPAE